MTMEIREVAFGLELRDDSDGRTLVGALLPYGLEARIGPYVVETFERGAFTGTEPARVPLTATHPRDGGTLPIGVTIELRDAPDALYGAWRVSDTALGNEVLALARDRVPLGLSVGFEPQPGGSQWNQTRTRVVRTRARMDHVAIVRPPTPARWWRPYGALWGRRRALCCSAWPGGCGEHVPRPRLDPVGLQLRPLAVHRLPPPHCPGRPLPRLPGAGAHQGQHQAQAQAQALMGRVRHVGRPWRRLRASVLAASDLCHLCGHPGAREVDLLTPLSLGGDPLDPANLRPAHGSSSPCPWCLRACNQSRGNRDGLPEATAPRQSRRW